MPYIFSPKGKVKPHEEHTRSISIFIRRINQPQPMYITTKKESVEGACKIPAKALKVDLVGDSNRRQGKAMRVFEIIPVACAAGDNDGLIHVQLQMSQLRNEVWESSSCLSPLAQPSFPACRGSQKSALVVNNSHLHAEGRCTDPTKVPKMVGAFKSETGVKSHLDFSVDLDHTRVCLEKVLSPGGRTYEQLQLTSHSPFERAYVYDNINT
ncbi:hypothetical protein C8R43DRAFT_942412 [Mycena crocata]|nr:hypothetical protein C8R43DRAFT_942412 [Mycena crocata]